MKPSGRAGRKVDANQAAIIEALEKTGATVQTLGGVGDGCPDLLVGRLGFNVLLEVKGADGKLNEKQCAWHASWRGQKAIVRDEYEAMAIVLKLSLEYAEKVGVT